MIAPGAAGPARPRGTTGAAPDRRRGQSVPCEGHHSFGVREWPSPPNEHPPHPQTSAFESQGKSYVENFKFISNLIMSPIMPPPSHHPIIGLVGPFCPIWGSDLGRNGGRGEGSPPLQHPMWVRKGEDSPTVLAVLIYLTTLKATPKDFPWATEISPHFW